MNGTGPVRSALGITGSRQGPLIMGVVNASPDSFSDGGLFPTLDSQFERAAALLSQGAEIIDVGGESARTDRPPRSSDEEAALVVPLISRIVDELGAVVSVDTYKTAVAREAVNVGARIINDISGLRDFDLARVAAQSGAMLVITHNEGRPKQAILNPERYDDVTDTVRNFLEERVQCAEKLGVPRDKLILDPGPDLSKTPFQTIDVLKGLSEIVALGSPVLLAVSRKDFIGALTERAPQDRLAGTLAAIEAGVAQGASILRVHDVGAVARFLSDRGTTARDH